MVGFEDGDTCTLFETLNLCFVFVVKIEDCGWFEDRDTD